MALWGSNDNLVSNGTVTLTGTTVTGTGSTFGTTGVGVVGNVIRFGTRGAGGTYFGDAVIVSVAGTQSCTINSDAGLSGGSISGAEYTLSELPKYTTVDSEFSEKSSTSDTLVYGVSNTDVSANANTAYDVASSGWVGVQTYIQTNADGSTQLRVKKEVLVAMSGITTGSNGIPYPTEEGS